MSTYLEDHPPARDQYRRPRRSELTGAIVVHTAENATDLVLPDAGAEGVARFISTRTDPGSYHTVVDSDSIVRVVPYDWEAYHEGTGGNRWSLGLSVACRADQWPALPAFWRAGALRNAATEARAMAAHVHTTTGVTVPARRITAAQYRAGAAGFIGHGELDPGRRHDPGTGFPWESFLSLYANTTTPEVPPTMAMPITTSPAQEAAQRAVNGWLVKELQIQPDGVWGDKSTAALVLVLTNAEADLKAQSKTIVDQARALEAVKTDWRAGESIIAGLRAEVDRMASLADVQAVRAALDRLLPVLQTTTDELGRLAGS